MPFLYKILTCIGFSTVSEQLSVRCCVVTWVFFHLLIFFQILGNMFNFVWRKYTYTTGGGWRSDLEYYLNFVTFQLS